MTLKDCMFWPLMVVLAVIAMPMFIAYDWIQRRRGLAMVALLFGVAASGQEICGAKTNKYEVVCGDKVVTPRAERYLAVTRVTVTSAAGGVAKVTLSKPGHPPAAAKTVTKLIELYQVQGEMKGTAIFNGDDWDQIEVSVFTKGY